MATIEIKQVYREIELSEYAKEYTETIKVHINPSRNTLLKLQELRVVVESGKLDEEVIQDFISLITSLWDGWTEEDVRDLFSRAYDTDPKLFEWLVLKTVQFIFEHRYQVKKN